MVRTGKLPLLPEEGWPKAGVVGGDRVRVPFFVFHSRSFFSF